MNAARSTLFLSVVALSVVGCDDASGEDAARVEALCADAQDKVRSCFGDTAEVSESLVCDEDDATFVLEHACEELIEAKADWLSFCDWFPFACDEEMPQPVETVDVSLQLTVAASVAAGGTCPENTVPMPHGSGVTECRLQHACVYVQATDDLGLAEANVWIGKTDAEGYVELDRALERGGYRIGLYHVAYTRFVTIDEAGTIPVAMDVDKAFVAWANDPDDRLECG